MNGMTTTAVNYLIKNIFITFDQLFLLFGLPLTLIIILSITARFLSKQSIEFWGVNLYLYGFSWLGTSVHELSHAFFALIFGHKITEIALFKPDRNGTTLGYVSHSYNKRNVFHQIGNFFIGVGPVIISGVVLFIITLLLLKINLISISNFRISSKILTNFTTFKLVISNLQINLLNFLNLIIYSRSTGWWRIPIYVYFIYSVGCSMSLSTSDAKSAFKGFVWIILFLLIFNLITIWYGNPISFFILRSEEYLTVLPLLLIIVLIANLSLGMILLILNFLKKLLMKH